MSIDKLQSKIRKLKNPSVLDMTATADLIPQWLLEQEGDYLSACEVFSLNILEALKQTVPAVRFSMGAYSLCGGDGLRLLARLTDKAQDLGYYVILDVPEALSYKAAQTAARTLLSDEAPWKCDAVLVSAYIGSDAVKPYINSLKASGKDLFIVVRTANKSAVEFQDLLTGTRLAHTAVADMAGRLGQSLTEKCGFSSVAVVASASSASSIKELRQKHKNVFFLLDGYDYPNANAKNCSFAFDGFGHGAAACANESILSAWKNEEADPNAYVEEAVQAAERMKKNLNRYITIL